MLNERKRINEDFTKLFSSNIGVFFISINAN